MDCPFICFEPTEEVLESMLRNHPDAAIYCMYGSDYDVPSAKSVMVEYIDINILTPSLRFVKYSETKKYHEQKPNLEKLLLVDMVIQEYKIHEAFYVDSSTQVHFSNEDLMSDLREHYHGLAAPYIGKGEMSFSFLYIRKSESLENFLDWMITNRYLKQSEAKTACMYWFENRTHGTDFLPSVSNECDVRDSDMLFATNLGNKFQGIWDNCAYGAFMGSGRESGTSSFPAGQFTYGWENGRPYIHRDGNSWPLYTVVTS